MRSWLPHGALSGSNGWTNNLEAREFVNDTAICVLPHSTSIDGGAKVGWKRLIQFALGSSDLEQYAILLVRVSLGLFFAISGANKLFVASGRQTMYETLVATGVPFPHLMAYFVSGVEFVGGCLLAVGFLSSLACVALLVDMLVAILTTKLSAMPKGLSPLHWLEDLLYLPEVLYVLFFICLICFGPGKFSVDYWLAGKLLR
jgi:putative oxidoreductase